jgi:hypothetical protein
MAVKSCIARMSALPARRTAMWIPPVSIVCAPKKWSTPLLSAALGGYSV